MTQDSWKDQADPEDFQQYVIRVISKGNGRAFQEAKVRETARQNIRGQGDPLDSESSLLSIFVGYSVCGTSADMWADSVKTARQDIGINSLQDVRRVIDESGGATFDILVNQRTKSRADHRPYQDKSATEPLCSIATDLLYDGKPIESLTEFFELLHDERNQRYAKLKGYGIPPRSAKDWASTQTFLHALSLVRNDRPAGGGISYYGRVGAFDWLELVTRIAGYDWLAPRVLLPDFVDSNGPDKAFEVVYDCDVYHHDGIQTLRSLTDFGRQEAGMTETGAVFDLETCLCVYKIRLQQNNFWWRK